MQVEEARLVAQSVAVQRRHVDARVAQRAADALHLAPEQDEIAGDGRLAAARRLEVDGGRHPDRGRQLHPHVHDLLAARDAVLIDRPVRLPLVPQGPVERGAVEIDLLRLPGGGRGQRRLARGEGGADRGGG